MHRYLVPTLLAGTVATLAAAAPAAGQDHMHPGAEMPPDRPHEMWMTPLGGGWHLMGMAHLYPALTLAAPFSPESPLHRTDIDLPHAAAMANLEGPGSRWVLRLMPNLEGITLPDGEVTPGGWGEGFIDSRHPHTVLHEAMVSVNWWEAPGGALSVSGGRGFAPYGTDDPMYRPALKYPTNHHLSQILERWTVNLVYLSDGGLGVEAGVFDGNEPEDPWDLGNFRDFGNSWSARLSQRFGAGFGPLAEAEASVSYARVRETHGDHAEEVTVLYNAALRHQATHGFGELYTLAEGSLSRPEEGEGYFSLLSETQLGLGRHRPFYRVEYATRPEYTREADGGEGFFRYDHDAHPIGATRWLINSLGYSYRATGLPLSVRPFLEVHHHRIWHERGPGELEPATRFGGDAFLSVALGARLFLGGGPMRMGSYGVLDPMSVTHRTMEHDMHDMHDMHHMGGMHPPHAGSGPGGTP